MNKKIALSVVLVLLAVIGLLYGITRRAGNGTSSIIREGNLAPEFTLPSLDRGIQSLSAHRGKVVLVHFWATSCPPCVEEIPVLEKLYRTMAGQDFEILAVSVDEGGQAVVAPFSKNAKLTFPVLLNPDRSAASRYGTYKFPETYVLDRDGIVRAKAIGARDWMHPEIMRMIKELLGEGKRGKS